MPRFAHFVVMVVTLFWIWILFYLINSITITSGMQGFAEKLFSRLQNCNERFEVHPQAINKPKFLIFYDYTP